MKSVTVRSAYPSELVRKQIIPFNITHFDLFEYFSNLSIDVYHITKISILLYNNERKEFNLELMDMHSNIACVPCKAVLLFNMIRFDLVDAECRKRNYKIQPIPYDTYTGELVDFCILFTVIIILICVIRFLVWRENLTTYVSWNNSSNTSYT